MQSSDKQIKDVLKAGRTQGQALAVAQEIRGCTNGKRKLQPGDVVAGHPRRFC